MNINPKIFRAYDIRGVYPSEVNEDIFYILGKPPSINIVEKEEPIAPLSKSEEKKLKEFREKSLNEIHNEGLKERLTRISEKQMQSFKT